MSASLAQTFPLLDLPNELLLEVFKNAPSLYMAKCLRVNKYLDQFYQTHKKAIVQGQVDGIVKTVGNYYKYLTTLHLDPSTLHFPSGQPEEGVTLRETLWYGPEWPESSGPGPTDFIKRVMWKLPYFETTPGVTSALTFRVEPYNWRRQQYWEDQDMLPLDYPDNFPCPRQHAIALTQNRQWTLDTYKAEIWEGSFFDVTRPVDIQNFFMLKRRDFQEWRLVLLPGMYWAFHLLADPRSEDMSVLHDDYVCRFVERLRAAGWPHNFDKDAIPQLTAITKSFIHCRPPCYWEELE